MNQKSMEIESRPAASDVALVCFSGSPGSSKLYSRLFFRSGGFSGTHNKLPVACGHSIPELRGRHFP
jgi:hypothetical protein